MKKAAQMAAVLALISLMACIGTGIANGLDFPSRWNNIWVVGIPIIAIWVSGRKPRDGRFVYVTTLLGMTVWAYATVVLTASWLAFDI